MIYYNSLLFLGVLATFCPCKSKSFVLRFNEEELPANGRRARFPSLPHKRRGMMRSEEHDDDDEAPRQQPPLEAVKKGTTVAMSPSSLYSSNAPTEMPRMAPMDPMAPMASAFFAVMGDDAVDTQIEIDPQELDQVVAEIKKNLPVIVDQVAEAFRSSFVLPPLNVGAVHSSSDSQTRNPGFRNGLKARRPRDDIESRKLQLRRLRSLNLKSLKTFPDNSQALSPPSSPNRSSSPSTNRPSTNRPSPSTGRDEVQAQAETETETQGVKKTDTKPKGKKTGVKKASKKIAKKEKKKKKTVSTSA